LTRDLKTSRAGILVYYKEKSLGFGWKSSGSHYFSNKFLKIVWIVSCRGFVKVFENLLKFLGRQSFFTAQAKRFGFNFFLRKKFP